MKNKCKEIIIGDISVMPETLCDAEDIYKFIGCDAEISEYTGWNPYGTPESAAEKIKADLNEEDNYSWVIRKNGSFAGIIGAYDYNRKDESIEIGYSIAKDFRRKGYAGKVTKAVVEFLLGEPQINKVRAWSHRDNIASVKVLINSGFKETGREKDTLFFEL